MLEKIKGVFISFFSFLWVILMALLISGRHDMGGAEMNGFISVICLVVFILLIIKKHPIVADILSTVVLVCLRVINFGADDNLFGALSGVIFGIVILYIFYKLFTNTVDEHFDEEERRKARKKSAKERGEAYCPYCGSTSIHYYPLGIPYDYYGEIRRTHDKYHCNNCNRNWW